MKLSPYEFRQLVIHLLDDSYGVSEENCARLMNKLDQPDVHQAIKCSEGRCYLEEPTAQVLLAHIPEGHPVRFIVDTEEYAGNFEVEMGAYMTGQTSEYSLRGVKEAKQFQASALGDPFRNRMEEAEEGTGFTEAYPTPGWFNNGFGAIFRDGQEEEAKAVFEKQKGSVTHEAIFSKQPAFLSVAITFKSLPSDIEIELLKQRASQFAEAPALDLSGNPRKPITITGFRIIPC